MMSGRSLKILPVLVMVAALSFGVRFGEVVSGKTGSAFAEDAVATPPESALQPPNSEPAAEKTAEEKPKEMAMDAAEKPAEKVPEATADAKPAPKTNAGDPEWKDAGDDALEYSESRMELFNDLSARRTDIESREKEMALREALLKAAEQEIDQKYKELNTLKEEIQVLLKQQTAEEQKRIASLVKIYEGMKAKDAARIFDTLDMDVLIQVMSRMSERKSAPIIAAMSPERARSLTIVLAEQKRLPQSAEPAVQ